MPQPPERRSVELLRRFSCGERWIHLCLGILMGACMVSAAFLYLDPLSALVGRRAFFAGVHFWSGVLLPLPIIFGLVLSGAFRADVRRLNRFGPRDWAWLKQVLRRRAETPSGKFNAGQKLNSAFVAGSVTVLFVTGLMLHFFDGLSVDTRTGATFTHDLFALAVVVVAMGHMWMAAADEVARRGLRTGFVPRWWAAKEHALWEQETAAEQGSGRSAE